jgi:gamma-glutamylcyclotransferase (GGCT)/AIG2-like uncharacterized protein YtfP
MNVRQEDGSVLMAVYGTLREGFGNWRHYLDNEHCQLLGVMKTEPIFTMISLGGFPGILENGKTAMTVEIFRVNSTEVERGLDRLEGYPSFYNKTTIETPWGIANMYILNAGDRYNDGRSIVESGDWKEYCQERYKSHNQKVEANVS